jgi:hypothetical protein
VDHLTRRVAEAGRQEEKLLDLFLNEQLDSPAIRGRLADIQCRKSGLEERLVQVRARLATYGAERARQDAIRRYCRLASPRS